MRRTTGSTREWVAIALALLAAAALLIGAAWFGLAGLHFREPAPVVPNGGSPTAPPAGPSHNAA